MVHIPPSHQGVQGTRAAFLPFMLLGTPCSSSGSSITPATPTWPAWRAVTPREAHIGDLPWVERVPDIPGLKGVTISRLFRAGLLRSSWENKHNDRIDGGTTFGISPREGTSAHSPTSSPTSRDTHHAAKSTHPPSPGYTMRLVVHHSPIPGRHSSPRCAPFLHTQEGSMRLVVHTPAIPRRVVGASLYTHHTQESSMRRGL